MWRGGTPGRLEGAGTPFDWPASIGFDRQPFANFVAGKGACVAGPDGLALGIFGWVDPNSGEVSNAQIEGGFLVFVLPVINAYNWQRCFTQMGPAGVPQLVLRAGLPCVVAAQGDFVTLFPQGAQAGQQVWVDPATGYAYGSDTGGLVASPWTVMENRCGCNVKLRISSFAKPLS